MHIFALEIDRYDNLVILTEVETTANSIYLRQFAMKSLSFRIDQVCSVARFLQTWKIEWAGYFRQAYPNEDSRDVKQM